MRESLNVQMLKLGVNYSTAKSCCLHVWRHVSQEIQECPSKLTLSLAHSGLVGFVVPWLGLNFLEWVKKQYFKHAGEWGGRGRHRGSPCQ